MGVTLTTAPTVAFPACGQCFLTTSTAYVSVKGLRHNALQRNTHTGENCPTLNTVIYIFKNEKDHCVLTTYLILFCGGCGQLCLSSVFCENLNETKNSKDSQKNPKTILVIKINTRTLTYFIFITYVAKLLNPLWFLIILNFGVISSAFFVLNNIFCLFCCVKILGLSFLLNISLFNLQQDLIYLT